MNKIIFATLTQEQKCRQLSLFVLMLKSAVFVIVVTLYLTVATATFQSIFAVVLMVVLTIIVIVKRLSELLWVYLQLFNLNVTFRCSFLLTTSAYQQKNAVAKLKTLAIFSEKYLSLLTNSSHQTKKKIVVALNRYLTPRVPVDAVNDLKSPTMFLTGNFVGGVLLTFVNKITFNHLVYIFSVVPLA